MDKDELIQQARDAWRHRGRDRPAFARTPGPGEESVWDYPRPPIVRRDARHVTIRLDGVTIADTHRACRLLETASPPTFYIPRADIDSDVLVAAGGTSFCEWKGRARYWDVVVGQRRIERAAWAYPDADGAYADLADAIAFYPRSLDCRVDGIQVAAQAGGFYGGWVTPEIVGPYKGEPGTGGW